MSLILRCSKYIWKPCLRYTSKVNHFHSTYKHLQNKNLTGDAGFFLKNARSLETTSLRFLNKPEKVLSGSRSRFEEKQTSLLDQELNKLDSDVRRLGRVRHSEVEKIFEFFKKEDKISSTQCTLIIRCCGSLMSEMPVEPRTSLLQDIWNTTLTQKCLLDISHYNMLLKIYLENEHKFDPIEFLSTLEQKNLKPNRITYQRLIARYCENGDIGGASKILESMKSEEMPINESIFNNLIMGHAKSGNMEDAVKILDAMRNAELSPSSSTYGTLACGYAITGDIEKVLATIAEANQGDDYLRDKDMLDIIFQLTINNHEDLVEQVLPKLKILAGYNTICANVILELVNRGYHKTAYKLLVTMPLKQLADGSTSPSGMFFIGHIVKSGLPRETVLDYCKELQNAGLNDNALVKAARAAIEIKKMDDAFTYLKELHSQNVQLRVHYFWPILTDRKGNAEALYEILKMMFDYDCPANYETLYTYVFPYLPPSDPETVINTFKDIGYDVQEVVNGMCIHYLQSGESKMAASLLEKYPVRMNTSFISPLCLAVSFWKSLDAESICQVLQYVKENPDTRGTRFETDLYGNFLKELVTKREASASPVEGILKIMQAKDMKISRSSAAKISNAFQGNTNISSILQTFPISEEVFASSENEPGQSRLNFASMSIEDLESVLTSGKSHGKARMDVSQRLITLHARNKNIDRVEELLKDLEAVGQVSLPTVCAALLELYVTHSQLDKALHYKNLLDDKYPNFCPDDHKIINLAKLLAANKKFEDAEKLIVDHFDKYPRNEKSEVINRNVRNLLDILSSAGQVQLTKKFSDILLSYDCCTPDSMFWTPVVLSHLVNNDLQGAVNEYLQISEKYRCTPAKRTLMKVLVEQEDPERLQSVVDASIAIHGEENVLIELATVFIDCGRIKQARKITETPGFRLKPERLNHMCENYLYNNKINELETFVLLTKDLFGAQKEKMYFYLLKGYVQAENVAKAINVWEMMQEEEENVQPSDQFLHSLGTFLQQMKQPVPFEIPECPEYSQMSTFSKIVEENNLFKTLEARQRDKFRLGSLNVMDMTNLLSSLMERTKYSEAAKLTEEMFVAGTYPHLSVLRDLGIQLSRAGNTTALTDLKDKMPPEIVGKIPFKDYIANSYIKTGKGEDFLKDLENNVSTTKDNFPGGGFLSLLDNHPQFLQRGKDLAEAYYKEGQAGPRKMLWIHYMKNHMFEDARKLLQSTAEIKQSFYMRDILSRIKQENDLALSTELLNQVKPLADISARIKGIAYSAHINVLMSNGNLDAAVQLVQEAQASLGIESMNRGALIRLQRKLQSTGKPVPFVIPEGSKQDTSSSSDSDDGKP